MFFFGLVLILLTGLSLVAGAGLMCIEFADAFFPTLLARFLASWTTTRSTAVDLSRSVRKRTLLGRKSSVVSPLSPPLPTDQSASELEGPPRPSQGLSAERAPHSKLVTKLKNPETVMNAAAPMESTVTPIVDAVAPVEELGQRPREMGEITTFLEEEGAMEGGRKGTALRGPGPGQLASAETAPRTTQAAATTKPKNSETIGAVNAKPLLLRGNTRKLTFL